MSKKSSTYRITQILKELNDGKLLCIESLASSFDTSTRSIRRDFELIRDIFGDIFINPQKGCYQAIQKTVLDETMNSTELYLLKNILKLSRHTNLAIAKTVDANIINIIVKDSVESPYLFKTKPYEEIYQYKELFQKLEHAIKYRKEITFTYINLDRINRFRLKPYKILFISENFYVASEFKNQKFVLSRIAMMKELSYTGNTFTHNYEFMEFIHSMQSPWATFKPQYKNRLLEVIVEIPKEQAKYFKLKKFMPSQKILDEYEDGTLRLSYTLSSQNEIFSLIKQWIPYIRIIAPVSLKEYFKDVARKFADTMNE
jgi:predicted DNA-binding transcriptional regulator YafY